MNHATVPPTAMPSMPEPSATISELQRGCQKLTWLHSSPANSFWKCQSVVESTGRRSSFFSDVHGEHIAQHGRHRQLAEHHQHNQKKDQQQVGRLGDERPQPIAPRLVP